MMELSNIIFTKPRFTGMPSAWEEHVPFAFYLIETLKPSLFVELGTFTGVSYFSFCQAVRQTGYSSNTFAVDHWKGDDKSGFLNESIYQLVDEINKTHFSDFSKLLRMSFDDALQVFENNTIDLLHIDGYHTYEAVKHDFETWLPKMSDKGVVIFHDTQEKDRDFGVWKLFQELKQKYPASEFLHGHGLGIVCTGMNIEHGFLEFVHNLDKDSFHQKLFASLGRLAMAENKLVLTATGPENRPAIIAQLFYSKHAEDFTEANSVFTLFTRNQGNVIFKIKQAEKPEHLRFDPLEDYILLRLNKIWFYKEQEQVYCDFKLSSNATAIENDVFLFGTQDPQIYIDLPKPVEIDEIVFDIEIKVTGTDARNEIHKHLGAQMAQMHEKVETLNQIIQTSKTENERLTAERNFNHPQFLQEAAELAKIRNNRFLRMMLKTSNLVSSVFNNSVLRNMVEKIQIMLDCKTLSRSGLFDRQFYLTSYPDVTGSDMSPERHYLRYGWKEGRNPSSQFDTTYYLANNRDVLVLGKNPLIHYIKRGQYENRQPKPVVDAAPTTDHIGENAKTMFQFLNRVPKMTVPHFSPPRNDFALEIPFVLKQFDDAPPGRIAVFCHIFYTSMVAEIKSYLLNIPYPFDLFITTDKTEKQLIVGEFFKEWEKGEVSVQVTENRGRDIAPKLVHWCDKYDSYHFCLHLHTKKSPQDSVLSNWREYLYKNLLGSEKSIRSVFEAFRNDEHLGMIAPQHFINTRQAIGWGYNFKTAGLLAHRMKIHLRKDGLIDFPSGSMFWARTASLKPLLALKLDFADFAEETGQTDGTLAHAIERLYFFACEKAGFKWIKISDPRTTPYPHRSFAVTKIHELPGLINQVQVKLLNEKGENMIEREPKDIIEVNQRLHFIKAQQNSPYTHLEPDVFISALKLHIAGKESLIDFDEDFYLQANQDIARFVASGVYECGFIHFCLSGRDEKLAWSNRMLKAKFNLQPNYPAGMFEPVNMMKKERYQTPPLPTPSSPDPFMLILFGHLQSDLFYAGYNAFFKDFMPVFPHFPKIVIAVDNENFESELATNFYSRIAVMKLHDLPKMKYSPDVLVCFSAPLVTKALKICRNTQKIVYYCQEFESGFFPLGAEYIEAESAVAKSHNLILSTELLRVFLQQEGLIKQNNVFVTNPDIEILDVEPGKTNKLFFYFRPEFFQTRNLPEIIWEAIQEFCNRHTGYELYLAGTIDTRFSVEINGNEVYVVNKLPKEQYNQLLASCDVAVAMNYSAHPGVIAFQAAASGIPTVTNVFKNRDAQLLRSISANIIPFDPLCENLCEKVEEALLVAKGRKHFNRQLFCGQPQSLSLSEFILQIVNQ